MFQKQVNKSFNNNSFKGRKEFGNKMKMMSKSKKTIENLGNNYLRNETKTRMMESMKRN